jgi:hypothetical protein
MAGLLLTLGVLAGAGCVPANPGPTPTPGEWPGANGKSGVNGDPVIDRASVEAFCTWRGRSCPVAMVYTSRDSWEKMTSGTGWMFDNFSGFAGQLVISQGLVPNGRGQDMASCARGDHDQDWRNFGTLMTQKGRGTSILRLGWEMNGTFMPWSGLSTQQYIDCYRHAALAIREKAPDVVLDWTINSHGTPREACGGVSTNCYPGDDVVDIIGIDNYDQGPAAHSAADFQRIAEARDGLSWTYDFALRHHKRFSVGEWGVAPGSQWNDVGENPEFIRWMHDWFAAHAPDVAYEAYFNSCQAGDVESNLYRPAGNGCARQNTNAGAVYQDLWGT